MTLLDEATTNVAGHWRLTKSGRRVWVNSHDRTVQGGGAVPSPTVSQNWWEMEYDQLVAAYPHIFPPPANPRSDAYQVFARELKRAFERSESITDNISVEVPVGLRDVRVAFYDVSDPSDARRATRGLGHPRVAAASANAAPTEPIGTPPLPVPPIIIAWKQSKKADLDFILSHELGHVADARTRSLGAFTSGATAAQMRNDEVMASVFAERLLGRISKHQMGNVGGNVVSLYRTKGTKVFTQYGGDLFEVRPEHHRVADLWIPDKPYPHVPARNEGFISVVGIQESMRLAPSTSIHHACLMGTLIMAEPFEAVEHLMSGPARGEHDEKTHGRRYDDDPAEGRQGAKWHDPKEHQPPDRDTILNRLAFIELAGGGQLGSGFSMDLEVGSTFSPEWQLTPSQGSEWWRVPGKAVLQVGGNPWHVLGAYVRPEFRSKGLITPLLMKAEEKHGTLPSWVSEISQGTRHNLAYKQTWRPMFDEENSRWYDPDQVYTDILGDNRVRVLKAEIDAHFAKKAVAFAAQPQQKVLFAEAVDESDPADDLFSHDQDRCDFCRDQRKPLTESAVERAHILAERLSVTTILERIETRLTRELEEAFRAQAKAFVAMYKHDHQTTHPLLEAQATSQSWVNAFEYASERTRSKFRRSLGAAVWAALRAGGGFALATLQLDPVLTFELPNPRAERYMDEHGATLIRGIEETTRDRIRDTVATGVQEGASPDDIARRIKRMYAGFSARQPQQHIKDRAHLIAVTEMGNAYSFGNLEVARNLQEAGLKLEKRWLHVADPRVDPDCLRNQEEGWIPLEAQYPTGHLAPLAHPACRCDQLYRLAEAALTEHLVTGRARGEHDEKSHGRSRIGVAPGSALQDEVARGMGVDEFAKYDPEALRILAEHKVELSHFSIGRGYWGEGNTDEQEFDIGMVLNGHPDRVEAAAEALRKHWKQTEVIVWHRHKGGKVPTASFSLRGPVEPNEDFLRDLTTKYLGKKGGWHLGFELEPEVEPTERAMRKALAKNGIVWDARERHLFIARPSGQTSKEFTGRMRRLGEGLLARNIANSMTFDAVEAVHLRNEGPLRVVENADVRDAGLGAESAPLEGGVGGGPRHQRGDVQGGGRAQEGLGREPSDVEAALLLEATTRVRAHYRRTKNGLTLVRGHDREVDEPKPGGFPVIDPVTGEPALRPYTDVRPWWEMTPREIAAQYPEVVHNRDGRRQQRIALLANIKEGLIRAEPVTKYLATVPQGLRDVKVLYLDPDSYDDLAFAQVIGLPKYAAGVANVGLSAVPGYLPMETPPLILSWSKVPSSVVLTDLIYDKEFTLAHELGHIADARSRPGRGMPPRGPYDSRNTAHRGVEIQANLFAERVLGRIKANQNSAWGGNVAMYREKGTGAFKQFTHYGRDVYAVTPEHLARVDALLPGTTHPQVTSMWTAENIPIREAIAAALANLVEAATDEPMATFYGCMEGMVMLPNGKAEAVLVEHLMTGTKQGEHDELSHGRRGSRPSAGVGVDFGNPIPGEEFKPRRATPLKPRLKPSPQAHTNASLWFADKRMEGLDLLVHADIVNKDGKKVPHAWIERGEQVIDPSRSYDEPYKVNKGTFYKLAQVNEDSVQRFSAQAAMENIMERGTHGPWKPLKKHVAPPKIKLTPQHIDDAVAYAAANNQGRVNADGTRSKPWTAEQIRAEMKIADEAVGGPDTMTLYKDDKNRMRLQKQWVDEEYGTGSKPEKGQKPQAYFYIGPSGAGKSFLSDLDAKTSAKPPVETDADRFKAKAPEYEGGLGADRLHEESSYLKGELLKRAFEKRDNIAVPVIGKSYAGLKAQILEAHHKGWDVHLRLTNVTPQMSLNRVITRFVHEGRYIPPKYVIESVGEQPEANYVRLLDDPEIALASNVAYMTMARPAVRYSPEKKRKAN